MLEIIAIICAVIALALLVILSHIDLKEGLLPNELVLGLAATGLVFHLTTIFHYLKLEDLALGAFVGGGMLYVIRTAANYYYQDDTLGLGDVKLMAASGVWLGPEFVLIAMTIGAFAGFLHGLGVALYTVKNSKMPMDFNRLSIPAGPGFAVGIVVAGILEMWDFSILFWQ